MKKNLRLDVVHPDKVRVEHFLNAVDEDLEPIPFDVRELNGVDDDTVAFKFRMKDNPAVVIVIFAESYADANKIEAANLTTYPNIQWTINGSILFGVESNDADAAKEMLSLFAGRE